MLATDLPQERFLSQMKTEIRWINWVSYTVVQTDHCQPYLFIYFFCHTHGTWKIQGQGSHPLHNSNLSQRSDNGRSRTFWATRELPRIHSWLLSQCLAHGMCPVNICQISECISEWMGFFCGKCVSRTRSETGCAQRNSRSDLLRFWVACSLASTHKGLELVPAN